MDTPSVFVKWNLTAKATNRLLATDIAEHLAEKGRVFACVELITYSHNAEDKTIRSRVPTTPVNCANDMAASYRATTGNTMIHTDLILQFTA